jgi:LCP family protein required for cell wall assembly
VLVGLQFLNNARMTWQMSQISENNAVVIDEVGQIVQSVNTFGTDLNEVREFLLLPTHDYEATLLTAGGESEEEFQQEETSEDVVVEIFNAIEEIGSEDKRARGVAARQEELNTYLNDKATLATIEAQGLFLRNGIDHHLADVSGIVYLTIHITDDGAIEMTTYGGAVTTLTAEASFEDFKAVLQTFLETGLVGEREMLEQAGAAQARVYNLLTTTAGIQEILTSKDLSISPERETTYHFVYDVLRKDGMSLASIVIDKGTATVWIETSDDASYGWDVPYDQMEGIEPLDTTDTEPFETAVLPVFEALEGETEIEKEITELQATLEALQQDEGFQALLDQHGLTFTFIPTETDTAWEYSLLRSDGTVLRIFYIDKATGELMIKSEGAETGSLLSSPEESEPLLATSTSLPTDLNLAELSTEQGDEFNILIGGKHGSNVDTIMVANIDATHQKVTLISIPRDLYYNGRKINSVYAYYGMDEMARELSDITGLTIDQYLLVDMYVFIDLVDMVGGIDVTLEEDLIDPTYKTYDNGFASTLYYPAGTHHFDGTQALRIARSRHTTSDYSRAERQQLILTALKDKVKTLGLADATTIVDMIHTTLDKTETNISFDEAFTYYFRYQNYELARGGVLSSGNVLASVKVPVNFTTSLRVDTCTEATVADSTCQIQYAVYTLSPREGNWDYIKWYVREQLKD